MDEKERRRLGSRGSFSDDDDSSGPEEMMGGFSGVGRDGQTESTSSDSGSSSNSGDSSLDDDSQTSGSSSGASSSDDDSEDEHDKLQMPLSERIKRQEMAGVDLKHRRQRKQQALEIASERLGASRKEEKQKTSKKSKHAPTEASSKRKDFFGKKHRSLQESGIGIEIKRPKESQAVDPRHSNLHGHLNMDHFEHNYRFLKDIREKEIQAIRQRITAHTTTGKKGQHLRRRIFGRQKEQTTLEQDREMLKKLLQEKADAERSEIDRAAKRSVKKKLHKDVEDGKRGVFFLKRNERKRLELEAKYDELRKRGGGKAVEKLVAKKRKKNKSRDSAMLGGR